MIYTRGNPFYPFPLIVKLVEVQSDTDFSVNAQSNRRSTGTD